VILGVSFPSVETDGYELSGFDSWGFSPSVETDGYELEALIGWM